MTKQFEPTQRRKDEARRKGTVLKSGVFTAGFSLAASTAALAFVMRQRGPVILSLYATTADGTVSAQAAATLWASECARLTCVPLVAGAMAGLAAECLQVRPSINVGLLAPDLTRLWKGGTRLLQSAREIPVLSVKLFWALGASSLAIYATLREVIPMVSTEASWVAWCWSNFSSFAVISVVSLVCSGVLDYLWKRRTYYRDLSMSLDELRREHREQEGDPHARAARKAMHEALAMHDLISRVRRAKVIVVERA